MSERVPNSTWAWRDELRPALARVCVVGPVLVATGIGPDVHDISWLVYYGGVGGLRDAHRGAALVVAAGLGFVLAALALRAARRGLAGLLVCVCLVGLVSGLDADGRLALLPGAVIGWILLAAVSAVAVLAALRSTVPPTSVIEARRWWLLVAAVASVVFVRLLGHHFLVWSWPAWAFVVLATILACGPRQRAGVVALMLLAAPAGSALVAQCIIHSHVAGVRTLLGSWASAASLFGVLPVLAIGLALGLYLRYAEPRLRQEETTDAGTVH